MDDLIYRKDIAERLERVIRYGLPDKDGYHCVSAESVLETVNRLPSAERKVGGWNYDETASWKYICPFCEGYFPTNWNYCPNCGARMGVE